MTIHDLNNRYSLYCRGEDSQFPNDGHQGVLGPFEGESMIHSQIEYDTFVISNGGVNVVILNVTGHMEIRVSKKLIKIIN